MGAYHMQGSANHEKHGTPNPAIKDRDNREKYESLEGVTKSDVDQLLNLDKEIMRVFEIQMRKRNKNDEMIRNKINDLNEKPSLRNYLFKKVS